MKLSQYIKELQQIQRQLKRKGIDPEVAISRYSDFTTDLGDQKAGHHGNPNLKAKYYPRVVKGVRFQDRIRTDTEWITRYHPSMPEETTVEFFVELAAGN